MIKDIHVIVQGKQLLIMVLDTMTVLKAKKVPKYGHKYCCILQIWPWIVTLLVTDVYFKEKHIPKYDLVAAVTVLKVRKFIIYGHKHSCVV